MELSIVSPIYKGEKMLDMLVDRIEKAVKPITSDYEIILVNDHSPDASWQKLKEICSKNPKVIAVDLSRNFGQHPAITAGLKMTRGKWVIVMDCDLQDRPEEIPNLYAKAQEGWDVVYARRVNRKDGYWKRMSSTVFYAVFNWLSGVKMDKTIANFGIYSQAVIKEVCRIPDQNREFTFLVHHIGFPTTAIDVVHAERAEGTSGYTLIKLLKLAFEDSIANTNKPLRLAVELGITMAGVSFILALYNVFAKLLGLITVAGYTTTVFSIWFVGGLLLFVLGVIGLYVGRIYDQVKGRPYVIVREVINGPMPEADAAVHQ